MQQSMRGLCELSNKQLGPQKKWQPQEQSTAVANRSGASAQRGPLEAVAVDG